MILRDLVHLMGSGGILLAGRRAPNIGKWRHVTEDMADVGARMYLEASAAPEMGWDRVGSGGIGWIEWPGWGRMGSRGG